MLETILEHREARLSKEKPLTASWLLGVLVGVIIIGGGAWCSLTLKKVFDLEAGDTKRQVEITEIKMEQKAMREEQGTQRTLLNRVDRKLDKLLGVPSYRDSDSRSLETKRNDTYGNN